MVVRSDGEEYWNEKWRFIGFFFFSGEVGAQRARVVCFGRFEGKVCLGGVL